jgi:regulatory protein YycH of two-component signal transduction system YycFG
MNNRQKAIVNILKKSGPKVKMIFLAGEDAFIDYMRGIFEENGQELNSEKEKEIRSDYKIIFNNIEKLFL